MKSAILSYVRYTDFNPIQNGLSVNYYGNNSKAFSFPLRDITANGSGIILVFNNTTDVSLTGYIVNTENTTLLKRIGFSVSSQKLDLSTSYGSIVQSITVSTSSFQQYNIDLQENPISNLIVYITGSKLPSKGIFSTYMYVPEINIQTSKYNTISKVTVVPYVYVTNYDSNNVSIIDPSTNSLIKTVPVETEPYYITIPSNSNYAYIANSGSNTVSVIDITTNLVVKTINVGSTPEFVLGT